MKLLTTNFLTCAVRTCKSSPSSYPLHYRDASLARTPLPFNPLFMRNILPRLDWAALVTTATELGLQSVVPERNPLDELAEDREDKGNARGAGAEEMELEQRQQQEEDDDGAGTEVKGGDKSKESVSEEVLKKLHNLLLETAVTDGKLVCGNCGFEYPIKDGVGNFLLPAHLV